VNKCHGARGGSGNKRGIVGSARDRVMYVGDHAADRLNGAVSSAWGPVPCGLSYVGTYDRSMGYVMLSEEGLMESMGHCL